MIFCKIWWFNSIKIVGHFDSKACVSRIIASKQAIILNYGIQFTFQADTEEQGFRISNLQLTSQRYWEL